jgi:type IV secretory pathway ATPase VirB11/archaellum biosynthesis ATPase
MNPQEQPSPVIRLSVPGEHTGARQACVETRPCFASSWIENPDLLRKDIASEYAVAGVDVTICSPSDASRGIYLVDPPEYRLSPPQLKSLGEASEDLIGAMPSDVDFRSLDTIKPYIKSKAKDRIYSRLVGMGELDPGAGELEKEAEVLSEILCKFTAGFGVLETLLQDERVQDIYIDAPSSQVPVQVVLRSDAPKGVRQKCRTNIFVGTRDLQGFVSRIKFETGLPFSEAHPVLEADMRRLRARVTLVGPPLSAKGVSVAIRKHSERVWTLPMLIRNGTLSPLLSSLLWACVIGRRAVLVAGSRGAGKTTLLGAMMLEFPLSQRIILIEDTPELSLARMQALGYDVQALRFDSEVEGSPTAADNALRVSLRMGESAIVIGEVRGEEASVLYESMRAGSAGSSVLGTIHGNSAKGVLDRAVEDLGVSPRAFSSTDIVIVIGLVRTPDGTRFSRKVAQVSEVRDSPRGVEMVDLFTIEPGCACAKPTMEFSATCKTVRGIADALGTTPERVLDIVRTRAHSDQVLSEANGISECGANMEDAFRVKSNEVLARTLFSAEAPEAGLKEWRDWLESARVW